jgi:hypothetical protein
MQGLKCIGQNVGQQKLLEFVTQKAAPFIKTKILENEKELNPQRLAQLGVKLVETCPIAHWQDIMNEMLPPSDENTSMTSSLLVTSLLQPEFTCLEEEPDLPQIWSRHLVEFFTKV